MGLGRARGRRWPAAGCRVAQSLLEELLHVWPPLASLLEELLRAWPRLARAWPAAGFRVAGAVHSAHVAAAAPRRSTQSLLGGAAARVRRWPCGRRSTQSLLEELLRAWPPLLCGRRAFVGKVQCTEPLTHHLSNTIFHTRHLSHTTLSHTIFHTQLCHTPSFTHHLSHTTLSHTIFDTPSLTPHL